MERARLPSDEIGHEKLSILVGSAVIMVTDDIEGGRREGAVRITSETYAQHKLTPGKDLGEAIVRYLPTRIKEYNVVWEQATAHKDEVLRWTWKATGAPGDAAVATPAVTLRDVMRFLPQVTTHTIGYTTTFH